MDEQAMSSSDLEAASQTETEETDTLDTSDNSNCDSAKENNVTEDESAKGTTKQNLNISVDFTEVSDLESIENSSEKEETDRDETDRDETKPVDNNSKQKDVFSTIPGLDFSKPDWYNHECFGKYWEHYRQCMSWCQKHFEVCDRLTKQETKRPQTSYQNPPSPMPFPPVFTNFSAYPSPWQHPYYHQNNPSPFKVPNSTPSRNRKGKKYGSCDRKSHSRRKVKHRKQKSQSSTATSDMECEFEMEITQDMIDFFAKSHEHRRQRDLEKNNKTEDGPAQEEHVNIEQLKVSNDRVRTVEAPKERPGARRTAEMKLLYGKGAAMIHGMETALQMTFDRNLDIKQPKFWPNMPLRVVFG